MMATPLDPSGVTRASRGSVLGEGFIALLLGASAAVAWRVSPWAGLLALPAVFVLLVLTSFAISAAIHSYRWRRNPRARTCTTCGAAVRYREGTTCNNCGTEDQGPRL